MTIRDETAVRAKGVLRPWQRRLYAVLLVPLGLMAANSIYLLAFTKYSSFFMAMLLMHLVLGLLIAIPFLVFALTHGARMLANIRNRKAKIAGIAILTLALTCVGTGVTMALKGATLTNRPIYLAHVFAIPVALVAFILHRRAAVHKLHLKRLFQWGGAVAAFLLVMAGLHKLEKPPQRIVNREGDTQFFLSSAETFDRGLLDGRKLAANQYCQECHPDSFRRWEKGAHRFSSFNNPFYRRAVELMADQVGREKTKWCAGCHDPVVLFTGQMGKATMATFSYDQFEAQQGLTCMACHSIAEVKDLRGNGGYVIEESKQYPFAFANNEVLKEVNKLLIRMEPSLHRRTFMKPFMRTPEFCSTCHKVGLLPPMNEYRWLRGQNHYDSWFDSGVSGNAVRSFYDPPKAKACRDCHLPLLDSREFGSVAGKVHDHLFPAANTALPAIRGDKETIEDIRKKALVGSLSIDLFALKRGGEVLPLGPPLPSVRPGETVDVEVVVRTRTVGHPYTNGTADSNETWVEFHADDGPRSVMVSGTLDAAGRLDPAADKLSQLVIAHDGSPMDRRQPQDIHVPLFNNFIPPGAARTVHYRFTVPAKTTGSIRLSAAVNYRKFSRDYSIFVGGKDAPELPTTRISTDSVTLPVLGNPNGASPDDGASPTRVAPALARLPAIRGNPDFPDRQWVRWNDYGIGLLLQGDLKGASAAFRMVADLAREMPDGPLNLARCKVQEGDLPAAKAALAESERRRPGWGKTQFFRSLVSKEEGRLEDALADLDRVLAKFPKDRTVLNQKARVLYLAGRYADALPSIDAVLVIDGEDLAAHYNAMLCLKALGRAEEAAAEEQWYRYHKDDESARALLAEYRIAHPYDNRESLPVHVHGEATPAQADPPAWLAEIGRNGYAYKGYAPKGEMVLKDDRPRGAARPFARPGPPARQAGTKEKAAAGVPVAIAVP
ncbi:MAG: multiheme c-type cytochrome [Thermoanaerobaculia bacterium]